MIRKLSVKKFKSIKKLEIDCRRVNLFIGEPNTGKSNILETLGLLSWCGHASGYFQEYVRFQDMQNLFYDGSLDEPVEVGIEKTDDEEDFRADMKIRFGSDGFRFSLTALVPNPEDTLPPAPQTDLLTILSHDASGMRPNCPRLKFIKLYRFERQYNFPGAELSFLMPPHGSNMFAVVGASRKLRRTVNAFFERLGLALMLRMQARQETKSEIGVYKGVFEILKQTEDVPVSYPYMLTSDTLQRMVFYTVAIESNENSTLIFEEPESHAFPYYTKFLGEKIAFDESNQYFITTHNPYLLLAILEKAPENDVNVFITYFKDYQTKVKRLSDEEVSELMDYEPFFNLDSFIEDEEENVDEDEGELQ